MNSFWISIISQVLQTLEGLRKSLQQQSALLATQRTAMQRNRLDSL